MSAPQRIALAAVDPGMELGEVVFGPLHRDDIDAYAHASGDMNPIHQDEDYAQRTDALGDDLLAAAGCGPATSLCAPHESSRWILLWFTSPSKQDGGARVRRAPASPPRR